MNYEQRLQEVRTRIAEACSRAGRTTDEVKIVAVTKYVGVDEMQGLLHAGLADFGENRIQVALPKWEHFTTRGEMIHWHYIGSLQTNKLRDVLGKFVLIHSLDRLSLAEGIQKRADALGERVSCLVQVNVSGEASKGGFAPDEVPAFLARLREMPAIEVRGYMTMAPIVETPEEARPVFRRLRELRDEWLRAGIAPETAVELSMGMSADYEVAVEEGATLVRLGSILVKP